MLAETLRRTASDLSVEAREVGASAIQEKKHLEPAVLAALRGLIGDESVVSQKNLHFKHWQGVLGKGLGGVDVAVVRDDGGFRALIELKWCPLDGLFLSWAIWDFYKMATGRISPGADACYLVAGAPDALWEKLDTVGELFCSKRWTMSDVYLKHEKIFYGNGEDCKKLTALPPGVETTLVADQQLLAPLEGWHIRAIRIEPDPEWLTVREGRLVEA